MTQLNNGLNSGPISPADLMQKLARASKVMQKVDSGNYQKGNINEDQLVYSDEPQFQMESVPETVNVGRIQNSKLPDHIKKAMIDNPIQQMPQVSLNETLDMSILKGAKRLIDEEHKYSPNKTKAPIKNTPVNYQSIDMSNIAMIIENTVRKVLDEKLNQLLTAQQTTSINETLVLKVGDSIFKGKITGVNKSK
jgi:hypothetical protein